MPRFKDREDYEAWKAEKLRGSKEKLMTEPQELSPMEQRAKLAVAQKKESQRIRCPECSSSEVDVKLSNMIIVTCLQCRHSWTLGQSDRERSPLRATRNRGSITQTGWTGIAFGIALVLLGVSIAIIGLFLGTAFGELLLGVLLIIMLGFFISIFCYAGARSDR